PDRPHSPLALGTEGAAGHRRCGADHGRILFVARAPMTFGGERLLTAFALSPFLLISSAPASAHLVSTGLGPVYDSVSHLLLSPEFRAPALGLALLAGLRGADHGRWALFTLTGAWLVGSWGGLAPPPGQPTSLSIAGTCLLLGGLAAADVRLPLAVTTVLA